MRFKILFTILITGFSVISVYGQSYSEKRVFRKTLPVNKETSFELDNKYGTVHISTWNKDSVSVRAELEAFASSEERLRKMYEGIDINISDVSYIVKAETRFTQSINMLFESFKGMTNKIIPYESRIEINYFVSAPAYLNMRIVNRYGDVYMEDNTGKFSLNLTNGSFEANSIEYAGDLQVSFCDLSVNRLGTGRINASFSELTIGESDDLTITSISSRFDLRKAGRIDTESRRDKFYIGSVGSIRGNAYFTDYRVEESTREINLDTKYGNLNIDLIKKGTEIVTVNSGYTDINLTCDPAFSYNLDIRHANSFVVVPDEGSKIEKKTLNEEKKEYMTFGTVGRNPGSVKVVINATRGNIYIK